MRLRRSIAKIICGAMTTAAVLLAAASGSAAVSAKAYVENLAREAKRIMDGGAAQADAAQLAEFDVPAFARRCMIDHWNNLSADEQSEFIAVFGSSLKGKLERLMAKATTRRNVTFVVGSPKKDADGVIQVPLNVRVDDVTMTFVYSLIPYGAGYRLVDYEVDGVLLSRNYRGQFNHMMRKYGFAGMLGRMREKLAAAGMPESGT